MWNLLHNIMGLGKINRKKRKENVTWEYRDWYGKINDMNMELLVFIHSFVISGVQFKTSERFHLYRDWMLHVQQSTCVDLVTFERSIFFKASLPHRHWQRWLYSFSEESKHVSLPFLEICISNNPLIRS